jgi:hypothetical protein
VNDLGMRLPLSDLFSSELPETLRQVVQTARYVGQETIAGELCDHVAVRGARTDWQVWVTKGDQPQFRRVVITYRRSEGQPQFWAQFRDWNFSPDVQDMLFVFRPAEGAVKIPFARRQSAEAGEQERRAAMMHPAWRRQTGWFALLLVCLFAATEVGAGLGGGRAVVVGEAFRTVGSPAVGRSAGDDLAVAAGASLTAAAFRAMTCPPPVTVGGVPYYQCGGAWYSPAYQGGNVTYIVVNPPSGY